MKKLIGFLILALFATFSMPATGAIIPQGGAAEDSTGTLIPGTLDQFFIKVKNGDGSALANGEVVCWDDGDDDGYSVDKCAADGDRAACVVAEAISAGEFGKCQVFGYHSAVELDVTNGDAVAGECLQVAGTDGAVSGEALAATDLCVGVSLDASSSSGTVEAMINLL